MKKHMVTERISAAGLSSTFHESQACRFSFLNISGPSQKAWLYLASQLDPKKASPLVGLFTFNLIPIKRIKIILSTY